MNQFKTLGLLAWRSPLAIGGAITSVALCGMVTCLERLWRLLLPAIFSILARRISAHHSSRVGNADAGSDRLSPLQTSEGSMFTLSRLMLICFVAMCVCCASSRAQCSAPRFSS